ncbi:hypothetical protein [Saccharicrinis sp. FJH54]|uniref:hypothetical protein n=1 Tax=Saccharicrinis sp. FJH54 TaxID=3344665 RepID=UPI0035D3FDE9
MKTKVSKRDVVFFLLGIVSMFLVDLVMDWTTNATEFEKGINNARQQSQREVLK